MLSKLVLVALAAAQAATAALTADTEAACSALFAKYPDALVWDPLGPNGLSTLENVAIYKDANLQYWNSKSSSNRAACTFSPSNAQEVSFAVGVLNKYPSVKFALKSGGHNPNLGYSSVKEGILIAFRPNSQYVTPNPADGTVDVGAGAKWEDVYEALQPLGKAAVGGRLGDIGVIGFTIGGGLSYLSAQYGLACDNVVNFETILANGTIANANATSNPELFFALKGGGNQYAIISKMTLKMYDVGDEGMIWGGTRIYTGDRAADVLSAVANFTANNDDPKAALIPTFDFAGVVGLDIPAVLLFFFYDGAAPANGVFDSLDAIPAIIKNTKTQTYEDVTKEVLGGKIEGLRFQIRENTFPNLPVANMSTFLEEHFDTIGKEAAIGALLDPLDFRLITFAVQPLTHIISGASEDAGGNALGLSRADGDRIWIEYDIAWLNPLCDKACPQYIKKLADSIHDSFEEKYSGIEPTNYQSGDIDQLRYNPIFMNDAMYDQKVLESYGDATYNRLKATHEAYDPEGFFATRQGGWTFTT